MAGCVCVCECVCVCGRRGVFGMGLCVAGGHAWRRDGH